MLNFLGLHRPQPLTATIFNRIIYNTITQTITSNFDFYIIFEMFTEGDPQARRLDATPQHLSEDQLDLQLHGFLKKETVNTSSRLERLRYQPRAKSKINIPLCRMISLPVVRPFLKNDVMNLAAHFVTCGYMEGNGVFYVALENNEGKTIDVTNDITNTWSSNWVRANAAFERELQNDEDLKVFSGKMFMVWDGNHRLQAWLPLINRDHAADFTWHYAVESIILEVKGDIATMLAALHEVNW
jgi:hypothetical protein